MLDIRLGVTAGGFLPAIPGVSIPVLNLTGGETDTPLQPQLNTGAFTLENGAVDTHASTDWQIATDAAFTTIVWSALASTSKLQITVALALNETSIYYARARHNGTTFQSQYSNAVMFNTLTVSIATPAITSPLANAIDIGETPAMMSSAFAVLGGTDTHASSDWQIASDAGFTTIVAQSLIDTVNKTSWTVPSGNLLVSTNYFFRVRHTGTAQGASGWSPVISFTTAAAFGWAPINTAVYDNVSVALTPQSTTPLGIVLSADGTKMYTLNQGSDTLYQYALTTPFDITTRGAVSSKTGMGPVPWYFAMSADGKHLYVAEGNNFATQYIHHWTLSIAWDITTAVFEASLDVTAQTSAVRKVAISADGTKLYTMSGQQTAFQYTLGTPYQIAASAGYSGKTGTISGGFNGFIFNDDGSRLYSIGSAADDVRQYSLAIPWDISTVAFDNLTFSVTAQDTSPQGLFFYNNGTKMLVVGAATDTVYRYSL